MKVKYLGYETLEEWIYNARSNIRIKEFARQDIVECKCYQDEEKLGEFFYKGVFDSAHHKVDEIDKQINWWKQLLGFLTELKIYRDSPIYKEVKEKENEIGTGNNK